jgi:hypothetical protein
MVGSVTVGTHRVRELQPWEWDKLAALPLPVPPPDPQMIMFVAEDPETGRIVGRWPVFNTVHIDGVYLAPDVRGNPRLVAAMVGAVVTKLQDAGVAVVYALTDTPESAAMAEKLGLTALPGRLYVGPVPPKD